MSDANSDIGAIDALSAKLDKLIATLERAAPPELKPADMQAAAAFVWNASRLELQPVPSVNRVEISLLKGIDQSRD